MSKCVPAEVFPPGEFIKEEIEACGWTIKELAAKLDENRSTVEELLAGRTPVTPERARRLAAAFGDSAKLWMNLQRSWQRYGGGSSSGKARRATVVTLDPDVSEYFPDRDSVNEVLRSLIPVIEKRARTGS